MVLYFHLEEIHVDTYPVTSFFFQYWTDSFIQWSPLGTYLATVHRQGSQVWGGENGFERLMRFAHPMVLAFTTLNSTQYLMF